jgi:uncharacterized membrane protein
VSYAIELFDRFYLFSGVFRWLHILVGIVWIGILYYFNLVQVPALAAYGDNAAARNLTLDQVARRALWWFRWSALATVIFGLLITGQEDYWSNDFFKRATGLSILTGMILGLVMFLNVWGVIWRKQKVVLGNARSVLAGQPADPAAAGAGRVALLASRQNFIFSVSMLWFMVGTAHFYTSDNFGHIGDLLSSGKVAAWLIISLVIIVLLELNALGVFGTAAGKPNLWPYENHRNAIISAFVLWAIFWILSELILKA